MPDIFVPLDTTRYTPYHQELAAHGVINGATIAYVEQNRRQIERQYRQFDTFLTQFEVSDELLADLRARADQADIAFDAEQYEQSLPLLRTQLKALIARDIWDMSEYYHVMNSASPEVQQALRVLNDGIYDIVINARGEPETNGTTTTTDR